MYYIVGLGNPGEEYENTRHNTGFIAVDAFRKIEQCGEWQEKKAKHAAFAFGVAAKEDVTLIFPLTLMNKSGNALKELIKNPKQAQKLIVVHDDMDLPLGSFKISFGRGSGGHRGVESIIKAIKTKDFVRIRVGVSHPLKKGGVKKPQGEDEVIDFILGKFKKPELELVEKTSKKIAEALRVVIGEGHERAMNMFN